MRASTHESPTPANFRMVATAAVVRARARSGTMRPPDMDRSTESWSVPALTAPSKSSVNSSVSPVRHGRSPPASGGSPQA